MFLHCNSNMSVSYTHLDVYKRQLKDRDGTGDEEEEQVTETRRSAAQNKVRKDGRSKCYRCGKPAHLQQDLSLIHI